MSLAFALMAAIIGSTGSWATLSHGLLWHQASPASARRHPEFSSLLGDGARPVRDAVAQRVPSARLDGIPAVPQNFIECDREQAFLMPPSLRDWLPADHLGWFVIESVERLDLAAFYAAYRPDGHGRAAYEPSVMGESRPVRVLDERAVLARDRASVSSGHCLSGDYWEPGA